jgi:hypothetical protein
MLSADQFPVMCGRLQVGMKIMRSWVCIALAAAADLNGVYVYALKDFVLITEKPRTDQCDGVGAIEQGAGLEMSSACAN